MGGYFVSINWSDHPKQQMELPGNSISTNYMERMSTHSPGEEGHLGQISDSDRKTYR